MSTSCAPTDRLLQTLKIMVPGATDDLISLQLHNVIDEFLRRTSAWQVRQEIELKQNEFEYGIDLPADSIMVRVMAAAHNNVPVPVATTGGSGAVYNALGTLVPEEVFPDGDSSFAPVETDLAGGVFTYAIYRPEYLTITGVPDAEARKFPMVLVSALSIAPSCLQCDCGDWALPEWMFDMYFQEWLDGVSGRMFGMLAKPWTNKELMIYHSKRFRNGMAFRKQEALRGFVYNTPAWRYPGGWV